MRALRDTRPGAGGEVQLTDALREVIVHGGRVLGETFRARAARLLDG